MVRFNWAARKLHKRLEQLGAEEFYPRGEADEKHAEGFVPALVQPIPLSNSRSDFCLASTEVISPGRQI